MKKITEKSVSFPFKCAISLNQPRKSQKFGKNFEKSNFERAPEKSGMKSISNEKVKPDKPTELKNDCSVKRKHDEGEERTVFVSNLSYSIREEEISAIFRRVGTVSSVRLVGDVGGRHRGYGYVEFDRMESVQEALNLDRTPVGVEGRPMYVSPNGVARPFQVMFPSYSQYSTDLDKCKLFLRNIPHTMNGPALEELLSGIVCGVRQVRLVTRKNGVSKRVAYVDFEDEVCFLYYNRNMQEKDSPCWMDGLWKTVSLPPPFPILLPSGQKRMSQWLALKSFQRHRKRGWTLFLES
ncbi:squamous cell carcinoma antigen recognized by T-cells 3-like [Octopus sinensis]|uniref:Squamous cell carcinoma antigen recognized by T-cells 3-like n=1 Tax=Octopus sinensis TaxID=2607531 RepID=A0A6P7TZA3_9MOLL|nr:squamous cell carcinoma antigen recognized by T-cells 3-like [Octopus sinensis]